MTRIKLVLAAAAALAAVAFTSAMSPDTSAMDYQTMGDAKTVFSWRTADEALKEGPAAKKFVLLDVYTDWCGWCKRMDRDTYANEKVGKYISERWIAAKMNPEKEGKLTYQGKEYSLREFGQALGVTGYPATAFFNENGELITVIASYLPADEFHMILRFIAEDHYKTRSFEEFKQENS